VTIISDALTVMLLVLAAAVAGLFVVLRMEAGTWRPKSAPEPRALPATRVHAAVGGRRPAAVLEGRIWRPGETRPARSIGRDGSDG
jgi:hypothetical protein